ncbi:hypothetical protein CW304_01145 [Bacillus sp. UFRGS-B20]|nr:hypothetical protein CW304_01145 [Bacillus sp. UFRGS-B20]
MGKAHVTIKDKNWWRKKRVGTKLSGSFFLHNVTCQVLFWVIICNREFKKIGAYLNENTILARLIARPVMRL